MNIKSSTKVKHALIQIWKDSSDRTSRLEETLKDTCKLFTDGKTTIIMSPTGVAAFEGILTCLKEDAVIGESFSRKELEKRIQTAVIELYNIEPQEIEAKINSYVEKMLQELERVISVKWDVYLPIENLVVNSELAFGRASIKMFDEPTKQSILQKLVTMIQLSASPPDAKAELEHLYRERLNQDYSGRAIMRVETRASDSTRAVESAIEQAETTLNILRFYSRGIITNDARSYRMYIGLKGTISRGNLIAVAFSESKEFTMELQGTGYFYSLTLGQKELSRMEEDSFKVLQAILLKETKERTAFENLLLNSVNLLGNAMNNQYNPSAFVSMVVALESILLKRGEPMRTLLAERTALILGTRFEERMFYFRQMLRLYRIRSDIVHRGILDVTESDIFLISMIVYRILVCLIADSHKFNDICKLVEMFNTLKFGYVK